MKKKFFEELRFYVRWIWNWALDRRVCPYDFPGIWINVPGGYHEACMIYGSRFRGVFVVRYDDGDEVVIERGHEYLGFAMGKLESPFFRLVEPGLFKAKPADCAWSPRVAGEKKEKP